MGDYSEEKVESRIDGWRPSRTGEFAAEGGEGTRHKGTRARGPAAESRVMTLPEGRAFSHERSNDKHQRARATSSRVKDELSGRALRFMR